MNADSATRIGTDRAAAGITSTVTWIPDLNPARRRALGEAVVALRLAQSDTIAGRMKAAAGTLEEADEETD